MFYLPGRSTPGRAFCCPDHASSQKAIIAVQSLPMIEAEAKERQRKHGNTAPGKPKESLNQKVDELTKREPKATIAVQSLPVIEAEAKERQQKAAIEFGRGKKQLVQKVEQPIEPAKKSIQIAADQIPDAGL